MPCVRRWVGVVEIYESRFAIYSSVLGRCGIGGVGKGLRGDLNR